MKHVLLCVLILMHATTLAAVPDRPLVIAHRGASGYLPEHTLEAKVMAFAQGADYLEQDVVMTADDALIVFHDLTLERMSDVGTRFPGRARADGSYYVIDFTLAELRTLQIGETQYPTRFPADKARFGIHTLQEELELIAGLQQSTGRRAGIYPELKSPWFHHQHGKDLARAVLTVLKDYGYDSPDDPVFIQTFDYNELVRVHDELLPALGIDLKLVQLVAENAWQETFARDAAGNWIPYEYDWMHTPAGLQQLARIADGIGPSYTMLVTEEGGEVHANDFTRDAHAAGLAVHPYTFRSDALPPFAASFEDLLRLFVVDVGVDGLFTDFPDKALFFLENPAAAGP